MKEIEEKCKGDINNFDKIMPSIIEKYKDKKVAVFHFTNLLPYEVENIEQNGLIKLTRESFIEKILNACDSGFIDEVTKNTFLSRTKRLDDIPENIGKIWYLSTPNVDSYEEYIQHWGGESIYQPIIESQDIDDFKYRKILKDIGCGYLIKFKISFNEISFGKLEDCVKKKIESDNGFYDFIPEKYRLDEKFDRYRIGWFVEHNILKEDIMSITPYKLD